MQTNSSAHDRNQLAPSIEKLFHYLMIYVTSPTRVEVSPDGSGEDVIFDRVYQPPTTVSVSPTLYTRLDDCHGAGNCCRVPFDLVYSDYDYQRIVLFDYEKAVADFGRESADRFKKYREQLLARLVKMNVCFTQTGGGIIHSWSSHIYVQRNTEEFNLSGNKSCPYLFIGGDRYFCGVHPFKPLHCWYPHMVVRANGAEGERPTITIGRMQYGRNHKFGCPVLFENSTRTAGNQGGIFDSPGTQGPYYFDKQFKSDYEKLEWTAKSIESFGFKTVTNPGVQLHLNFLSKRSAMEQHLASENPGQIILMRYP